MFAIIFAILAGISVTMQNSINGLMNPFIGAMGTAFVGFVVQVILLSVYQLLHEKKMIFLKGVNPVYYLSGLLATFTVGMVGYCVSQMGSAVTTCCSVSGQMFMSALVDHYGLFGTKKNSFSRKRIPGFICILCGVFAINLIGRSSEGNASLKLLLFTVILGCIAIVIRTLNFKASEASGSSIGGGFVNSLSGAACGFLLYFITSGMKIDVSAIAAIPKPYFLAGAFGTSSLLCNILAYSKQNIFYSTIFMLIGQVATGITMDIFIFHSLSAGKCIGIAIVLSGVFLDKILSKYDQKTP